jgi:hypothetical protein
MDPTEISQLQRLFCKKFVVINFKHEIMLRIIGEWMQTYFIMYGQLDPQCEAPTIIMHNHSVMKHAKFWDL